MKTKDFYFSEIFDKIKKLYPDFNIEFVPDEVDGNDKINFNFDGKVEFDSKLADKFNEILEFLKQNHYEINNPLNVKIAFAISKSDDVNHKFWSKVDWQRPYHKYRNLNATRNFSQFIGENNLLLVSFQCAFAPSDSLDDDYKEDIRDFKKEIDFLSDASRVVKLEEMLNKAPRFTENNNEYWFLNSRNTGGGEIKPGLNFFVSKKNDKIVIIGAFKLSFSSTSYSIGEIFIVPKFRKKGYSLLINKFIQENTNLLYNTKNLKTRLGHYQMIRNKRLLKYESFLIKLKK